MEDKYKVVIYDEYEIENSFIVLEQNGNVVKIPIVKANKVLRYCDYLLADME
jgi:uncharacterized protein YuzE